MEMTLHCHDNLISTGLGNKLKTIILEFRYANCLIFFSLILRYYLQSQVGFCQVK